MKDKINEHEFAQKMMEVLRGGYKSKLLTEADENNMGGAPEKEGDTLDVKPGDAVFNDELKKLQDTVNPRVKITNFKIYPNDNNVIIEGTLLQREGDESGIHFKMSLAAGDIETSMNNIDLDDNVSGVLQKLKGYYQNWCDEWATKLTSEYPPKNN